MQTAPAFLPLFLAVLCFSEGGEGDRRERAGEEDVAAFNFLSPFCTETLLLPSFAFPTLWEKRIQRILCSLFLPKNKS